MLALAVVVPASLGLMLATLTALPQLSGPVASSHLLTIGGLLTAILVPLEPLRQEGCAVALATP